MTRIFISYRRDDSAGYAGRLYDRLSQHFGKDNIFMDIDTIEPGLDFVEVIEEAVGSCDVLIALIGKQWLSITDATGHRRLDNPNDFVHLEIKTALERNIRVIPALVRGAPMPRSSDLPDDLEKLARRNALPIGDRFHPDVDRLIEVIENVLGISGPAFPIPKIKEPAHTPQSTTQPRSTNWPLFGMVGGGLLLLLILGSIIFSAMGGRDDEPPLTSVLPTSRLNPTNAPESATSTPTPEPAVTFTFSPTPVPLATATPVPLSEDVSRGETLSRGEERVSGRIIFPVFDLERGTYDIYIADAADGGNKELVQENASQPTLNKDGTTVAYRSWQPDSRGLFVRPLIGGEARPFDLFWESARPQFSPLDDSLIYHSRAGGSQPAVYRVIDEVSQVMRREGFPIAGEAANWSPDGQQFVYSGCLGSNCGIILSNIDGTSPVQLTNHPSDTNSEISPDGSTVVFMSERNGNWEIYRINIGGEDLITLTSDSANDGLPTWSPDGSKIAFVSNRDNGEGWAIWTMDPDGSNKHQQFVIAGSIDGTIQYDVTNSLGWLEENIDWIP